MSEENEVSDAPDEPGIVERAKGVLGLGTDAATDPVDPDPAGADPEPNTDEPVPEPNEDEPVAAPPPDPVTARKKQARNNAANNTAAKNKRKYGR